MTCGLKNTHTVNPWVSPVLKYDIQDAPYIPFSCYQHNISHMRSSLCFAMTSLSYKHLDMILVYVPSFLCFFVLYHMDFVGARSLPLFFIFKQLVLKKYFETMTNLQKNHKWNTKKFFDFVKNWRVDCRPNVSSSPKIRKIFFCITTV